MANTVYNNFFLSNEVEDQFNSHLDLVRFCTVDRSLEATPGMKRIVNVYTATDGTEILAQGEGNSKSITVGYTQREYDILLAQNRFRYYDEQAMTDPIAVQTGIRHMAVDMFNTVNADIYAEFAKADTNHTVTGGFSFDAFADAVATLNVEGAEDATNTEVFAWVNPKDMAALRKALKDDLKYVEAFVRTGYVGTVAGVNLYTKKDATLGTIVGGTKGAVTVFNKKGTEVEQEREANEHKLVGEYEGDAQAKLFKKVAWGSGLAGVIIGGILIYFFGQYM